VRDVRARQLELAVETQPHLATLLIGLNDVSRGGFCERSSRPTSRLWCARCGARERPCCWGGCTTRAGTCRCRRRCAPRCGVGVTVVNDAVDEAAADAARDGAGGDVHVLDLARMPALRLRQAWAVDRVHPHAEAHGLIAVEAARVLTEAGLPVGRVPAQGLPERAPGMPREAWWAARHGLPWLAAHARDVVLPAVRLAG
jgi:hypothetical protein